MTFALALAALLSLGTPHETTAYTHTGNRTASSRWPVAGVTVACADSVPLGTWVEIERLGKRRCDDRIGCCSDLDVFMDTRAEAIRWGRKVRQVKVIR